MIRKIGLVLSVVAIITMGAVGCDNNRDNGDELTTVIKKPDGSCIGHDSCPPRDQDHITAILEPSEVITSVEVPTVTLSPTTVVVPTVSPTP